MPRGRLFEETCKSPLHTNVQKEATTMTLKFYGPPSEWKALLLAAGIVDGWDQPPNGIAFWPASESSEARSIGETVTTQHFPDGSTLRWTDKTQRMWSSDLEDLPMMQSARLIIEVSEIAVRTLPNERTWISR
jgi:hypothetical protein